MIDYYSGSAALNFITAFLLGILFFLKRSKYKNYIFYNFAIAFWSFFYILWQVSSDSSSALLFCRLLMVGATVIPLFFSNFILEVTEKQNTASFKVVNAVNLVCVIIFVPLLFTNLIIHNLSPILSFLFWPKGGVLFPFFLLYFFINIVIAHVVLFRRYIENKEAKILYIFIATFIAFAGGSTNYFLWLGIKIPPIGNFLVTFYVLIIAYAITKHDLLDMKVIITRITAYGVVIVSACFTTLSVWFFVDNEWLRLFIVSILLIFWTTWGDRLRQRLQTTAESKWISDWYDPQKVLSIIAEDLSSALDRETILRTSWEGIARHVQIKKIGIVSLAAKDQPTDPNSYHFLERPEKVADTHNLNDGIIRYFELHHAPVTCRKLPIELYEEALRWRCPENGLLFPVYSQEMLEGILLFGSRLSQAGYAKKDYALFKTLSHYINAIFDRIRPYETIKQKYEEAQAYLKTVDEQTRSTQLIRDVAHELFNPMSMIEKNADLAIKRIDDPEKLTKFLDYTKKSIRILVEITERMLVVKKDDQIEERQKVDLADLLAHVATTIEGACQEKGITIETTIGDPPQVWGSQDGLFRVFMNLLSNAIDATTGPGTITISTSIKSYESWKPRKRIQGVEVVVKDTGKGIPADEIQRIFEALYSSKTVNSGSTHHGMGLYFVIKLLHELDGYVPPPESEVGKGTTFRIYLPIATDIRSKSKRRSAFFGSTIKTVPEGYSTLM